jgi:hypothetical protein
MEHSQPHIQWGLMTDKLDRIWKETGQSLIEVISQNFLGATEKKSLKNCIRKPASQPSFEIGLSQVQV